MDQEFVEKVEEVAAWLSDATSTTCGVAMRQGQPSIKLGASVVIFRSKGEIGAIVEVHAIPPPILNRYLGDEVRLIQRQSLWRIGAHKIGARILRNIRRAYAKVIKRVTDEIEDARI